MKCGRQPKVFRPPSHIRDFMDAEASGAPTATPRRVNTWKKRRKDRNKKGEPRETKNSCLGIGFCGFTFQITIDSSWQIYQGITEWVRDSRECRTRVSHC